MNSKKYQYGHVDSDFDIGDLPSPGPTGLVIALAIILVIVVIVCINNFWLNSPGATETRALANAKMWVADNNIGRNRISCSYPASGDTHSSCSVTLLESGAKINLQCPSRWLASVTGATHCAEIDGNFKITGPRPVERR